MFYNLHLQVVVADFGARSCPKDTELRNEPRFNRGQLAYHRTPLCNMYFVTGTGFYFLSFKITDIPIPLIENKG